MIKVTVVLEGKEKILLVPETKTLRDLLQENGIDTEKNLVLINKRMYDPEDLNKRMIVLADSEDFTVMVYPKPETGPCIDVEELPFPPGMYDDTPASLEECTEEVLVAGCACVVSSVFTPAELKQMKQYHPEAMTLTDEKGTPLFAIDITDGEPGTLNSHGAVFSQTPSSHGMATITILLDPAAEDKLQLVKDQLGGALLKLRKLENRLKEEMTKLEAEIRDLDNMFLPM